MRLGWWGVGVLTRGGILSASSVQRRPWSLKVFGAVLSVDPGGRLYIKTPSYKYRTSHYQDEAVSRPSHLCDGNPYTRKDDLYVATRPRHVTLVTSLHTSPLSRRGSHLLKLSVTKMRVNSYFDHLIGTIFLFPKLFLLSEKKDSVDAVTMDSGRMK